jgi:hypothetical protein
MPCFVTCIPLLLADRLERRVLEASHLGLQEPEVHERRTAVVVALGIRHTGPADPEDRDAAAVRAAHLDRLELAATHEPEGPEEEVVRLQHVSLPGLREERWVSFYKVEVSPSLL